MTSVENGKFSEYPLVGVAGISYKGPSSRESPDTVRLELGLESAERWRDADLPFVVVDSSPNTWVGLAFENRHATVLRAEVGGIATQRQQGIAYAVENGAAKMVGHEAEKVEMSRFAPEISAALDTKDILVIGRTPAARLTLPPVQRRTEDLAGQILQETLHLPPDALSGGRGFTRAGAEILAEYPALEPGMNNWIYLYDTPLKARAAGLKVGGLLVDLLHPEKMTADEMHNDDPNYDRKRYDQFKLQLDYLLGELVKQKKLDKTVRKIADSTLDSLNIFNRQHTNLEIAHALTQLEAEMARFFGYKPFAAGMREDNSQPIDPDFTGSDFERRVERLRIQLETAGYAA